MGAYERIWWWLIDSMNNAQGGLIQLGMEGKERAGNWLIDFFRMLFGG